MEDEAWERVRRVIDLLEIENAVKVAVRLAEKAATLAERERCAQIAESFIPSGFRGGDGKLADAIGIARDDRARTIAHAIRG